MESKSHALIAGVFTVLLAALATALALWLGKDQIQRNSYTIATKLKVSGLNVQAAVRYKGIKVGKVTDVDFDAKNPGQLLIQLDVVSDTPVTQSTYATLGYQGVTGIAYIELDDDGSQPATVVPDKQGVAKIPLRPGLLQDLENRGMSILAQTEELSKRLNQLLDKNNQDSLMTTVTQIGKAAAAWEHVPAKLEPVLAHLPKTLQQAEEGFASFKKFSDNATTTSTNFNTMLDKLQAENGAINQLTRQVDTLSLTLQTETLPNLHSLTQEARSGVRSINKTVQQFGAQPQSILFGVKPIAPGPGEAGFSAPPSKSHQ